MHVQSNVVSQPVNRILIERLPVQILAMGLDVVPCDFVERSIRVSGEHRLPRLEGGRRRFLGPEHNVSQISRCRAVKRPFTGSVRVMSAAYIEYSPAASMTTTSPAFIVLVFAE